MSVLFTAVSVEQQEIVAGGFLNTDNSNNANNGAIVLVNDSAFVNVSVKQKNVIKSKRITL
jgi:hypothetical protein